jgi:class 3 adenylate cyclase
MPTALAKKISAASSEILGERREVTVLFVNVTNCAAPTYELDSEDSFHLIDELLRLLVDVVYKYEGSIDKFTGDGLVALFGAPVAHENDPERAIRAALEMKAVIQPWRTGINQR